MGGIAVDLEGKVALVSGGSSGMGTAICVLLAASGASVVVGGRDAERTAAVVEAIRSTGGSAAAAIGDVADSAQADNLVATALAEFGGLDIVVNAAGVIHRADAEGTTDDDWHRVMSINVDGTFFLSRAAVPAMRQRGGGVIVNISSTCGLVGSAGLSRSVIAEIERALIDHELVKIRLSEAAKRDRQAQVESICESTGAQLVHSIGRVCVLFRPAKPPQIVLPAANVGDFAVFDVNEDGRGDLITGARC